MRVANYFTHDNKYERLNKSKIWPGGLSTAPLGRPSCGFENELCSPKGKLYHIKKIVTFYLGEGGSEWVWGTRLTVSILTTVKNVEVKPK